MMTTFPNRVSALLADPLQTMFRDFAAELPWDGNGTTSFLRKIAPLSMWDDGQYVHIDVDVPGIALNDLDVSVEKGRLTIRGQRKIAETPAEYMHQERFFGEFERTVVLDEWVDSGAIEATLKDGVLHLQLAKRPEAQRQRVAINYCTGDGVKRIESASA